MYGLKHNCSIVHTFRFAAVSLSAKRVDNELGLVFYNIERKRKEADYWESRDSQAGRH